MLLGYEAVFKVKQLGCKTTDCVIIIDVTLTER